MESKVSSTTEIKNAYETIMGYQPNYDTQLLESKVPFRIVELFGTESEVLGSALKDLERRIENSTPVPVIKNKTGTYKPYRCGNCDRRLWKFIGGSEVNYCPHCGKELDWNDDGNWRKEK